ncbi:hypothetical protein EYF80_010274 [Liparis tanakae]|uniref:Uncharacterized protein n=1 Tax=Liparis tanakae TaxID=230148 RepID=A0A4Z2IN29_9TELE|nr:hypothetical protein EYF80_010274 [Liparis tanakae]
MIATCLSGPELIKCEKKGAKFGEGSEGTTFGVTHHITGSRPVALRLLWARYGETRSVRCSRERWAPNAPRLNASSVRRLTKQFITSFVSFRVTRRCPLPLQRLPACILHSADPPSMMSHKVKHRESGVEDERPPPDQAEQCNYGATEHTFDPIQQEAILLPFGSINHIGKKLCRAVWQRLRAVTSSFNTCAKFKRHLQVNCSSAECQGVAVRIRGHGSHSSERYTKLNSHCCYAPLNLPISTQCSRIHQLISHHQVWTLGSTSISNQPVESKRQRL